MNKRAFILFVAVILISLAAQAQRPKWVNNTPQELNNTYRFVEVVSQGTSLTAARQDAKLQLAQDEQLQNAIRVNVESGLMSKYGESIVNGKEKDTYSDEAYVKMTSKGETYRLQARIIDEWQAGRSGGMLKLHTLYMVAITDHPQFDRTYLSSNYGIAPVFMSIIPGVGQIYKGSTVKGICLLGGVAVCGLGALLCENQRKDYRNKMFEQPEFAKEYSNKKKNWETGRNICIGAAAAVYLYNLIDAAVAKGGRKVTVKRYNNRLSFQPAISLDGAGVALTYKL
jgi:hypothetical protein